jgi:wobble nucleotide-excising tRNase
MGSANSRSGTSCTYNVVIYDVPVAVDGSKQKDGQPSFKTTLSAGDRNTLALAFYFASLDQHPDMKNCIAVIDDPMTSLDDHRTLTTVQEIRKLAARIKQTIVLSHAKPFLCKIWKNADTRLTTAILICRENAGSTIKAWDVNQDEITEYDRQHALLRQHASSGSTNSRDTAKAIRPTLEGFLRVACAEHFPPGTLLGPFRNLCKQRIATGKEILSATATQELEDLVEYANKFHHDTNPAWETEAINDGELLGYVKRGLSFIGFS